MITDDAERTMNTFSAAALISPADIDAEAIADSEYLYIEAIWLLETAPDRRR